MGSKEIVEAVCKAALLEGCKENRYAKKTKKVCGEKKGLTELPLIFPSTSYHIINLQSEPVSYKTFQSYDPNVRATYGKFMLTFLNEKDRRVRYGRRFVIDQDLIRARIFFYNYSELKSIAKRVPEVNWILQNSTFEPDLLDVARRHVGVPFVFTVDWVRYDKLITKKAEEQGIDIEFKPFVTHKYSEKKHQEEIEEKFLSERRDINDYRVDIKGMYERKPEYYEDEKDNEE